MFKINYKLERVDDVFDSFAALDDLHRLIKWAFELEDIFVTRVELGAFPDFVEVFSGNFLSGCLAGPVVINLPRLLPVADRLFTIGTTHVSHSVSLQF